MDTRKAINDFAILSLVIGVLSFVGKFTLPDVPVTPVDPNKPPIVAPKPDDPDTQPAPIELAALVIVDDFEDKRTPENAYLMSDDRYTLKFQEFAPLRYRYWDDETKPKTSEFQMLMSKALEVGTFPSYAIGKGGKVAAGKFDPATIDSVLQQWRNN